MALTAEDIVNKRFQSTKFREGYDQDEVDDFLDEVVVEMRRVLAENDDLTQKLAASEARIAELQRSRSTFVRESRSAMNSSPRDTLKQLGLCKRRRLSTPLSSSVWTQNASPSKAKLSS